MPLSDDEKRHIEAVEEYRHEVRRRLHPDAFASAKVLRYDHINPAPREKPTDVRYEEDKAQAESIRNELSAAMRGQPVEPLEAITPRFRSGSGGQIEVWLNRDLTLQP